MLNIIKSYLVSLGYHVDQASFDRARGSLTELEKLLSNFTRSSMVGFAKTGAAIIGFSTAIAAVLYQLTIGVANADLKNELFAKRMWMAKENAMAYKSSLDALGVSLQDLYLSPELMEKFNTLREQAATMGPPDGFTGGMKGIRDITFEFQRFKLEATYAVYWVGFYLSKYLSGPIFGLKGGFRELNDEITKGMPRWTQKIAQVASWFVRMGSAAIIAGKEIKHIWDSLGSSTRQVASAALGLFALLRMGPLGWIIAGLTTLMLLIDDYHTYSTGGESLLSEMWKQWDTLKKSLDDNGAIIEFKESLDLLAESIIGVWDSLKEVLESLAELMGYEDISTLVIDKITSSFKELSAVLTVIAGTLNTINGYFTDDESLKQKGEEQTQKGFKGFLRDHSWLGGFADIFLAPMLTNGFKGVSSNSNGMNILSSLALRGANPYTSRPSERNSNVTFDSKYYIYGANNAETVARTVNNSQTNLLVRSQQGVIV